MSSLPLEYYERQKGGKILHLSFRNVCADSSGMIKNQTTEKKGMSIVACFSQIDREQIRSDIIHKIYDLNYGFLPVKNLHSTLLTIYPSKDVFQEKSNHYFDRLIIEQIEKFFNDRKNNSGLTLKFNEVRPGTWYGLNGCQIPFASDGTVVAIGNPDESENKEFVTMADELICHLKKYLNQIFSDKFERKFYNIWSTLGYFHHTDFEITQKFADTFTQFKDCSLKIAIHELKLIEYSFKDLRKVKILKTFKI